ncbi:DUF4113 domain-containing protein [Spirosoma sp. KNUC1025]
MLFLHVSVSEKADKLNHRYGQDKLWLASLLNNPDWPMKQTYLSRW